MEDDVQLHGKDGKRFSGESFACGGRIKRSNGYKCHSFMFSQRGICLRWVLHLVAVFGEKQGVYKLSNDSRH